MSTNTVIIKSLLETIGTLTGKHCGANNVTSNNTINMLVQIVSMLQASPPTPTQKLYIPNAPPQPYYPVFIPSQETMETYEIQSKKNRKKARQMKKNGTTSPVEQPQPTTPITILQKPVPTPTPKVSTPVPTQKVSTPTPAPTEIPAPKVVAPKVSTPTEVPTPKVRAKMAPTPAPIQMAPTPVNTSVAKMCVDGNPETKPLSYAQKLKTIPSEKQEEEEKGVNVPSLDREASLEAFGLKFEFPAMKHLVEEQ